MNKITGLALLLFLKLGAQQNVDYNRAPNSYIFDPQEAQSKSYSGLLIPVKKAYSMWSSYQYLKKAGNATPISTGAQSATVFWEDVPGLIKNIEIVPGNSPDESKIKVDVNKYLGNGNAVIAFKVNGTVYWSWHIWVTDDPSKGVTYSQGFETDLKGNPIQIQYMDRNLGALSNTFLGNNWQKSGGLLYEWGRKDPFPSLVYKDFYFYEIKSDLGYLKHNEISSSSIPVVKRPYDNIEDNVRYAVNNPLNYVISENNLENWFSNKLHKVPGAGVSYETWDLWSDNYRGLNSNASSSNAAVAKDSKSYELKSELDPCPSGWRIPSYYGRVTMNNNLGFFGRKNSGGNDDIVVEHNTLYSDSESKMLSGIKVYPGLGLDFTNAQTGDRNLGGITTSGHFEKFPNKVSPGVPLSAMYQDENSDTALWSSTFGYDGARYFGLVTDQGANFTSIGKHQVFVNQTNPSHTGNAVKCMKDPNVALIGNFTTEYFSKPENVVKDGLNNPNTYLITDKREVRIPVNKPFAVRSQLFAEDALLPNNNLKAKVLWTTNINLVKSVSIEKPTSNPLESFIKVEVNPSQYGNFVVSLHNNSTTNPAYWSWYFWVPETNPTTNLVKYITEQPISTNGNFVNATKSFSPPLVTTMMDRNLGAIIKYEPSLDDATIRKTKGLLFQWGRKDALPSFQNNAQGVLFEGNDDLPSGSTPTYKIVSSTRYVDQFTKKFSSYNSSAVKEKFKNAESNIKFSIENPLTFLYQEGIGKEYDGGKRSNNNLNDVRDWVSSERSTLAERWGHGNVKSPFDPCPEGWRVPDVFRSILYAGSKGNSPFYNSYNKDWAGKDGVIQDQWADVVQQYNGNVNIDGWTFKNEKYPIGSYSSDGIRGELGNNQFSADRSGVWTASLSDLQTGYALAMVFESGKMQSGTGVYPQAAMSVRCAKDEARYLGVPVSGNNTADKNLGNDEVVGSSKKPIYLFPNPFVDELRVNVDNVNSYQLYDVSGKLLIEGKVESQQIKTSNLPKGMYLIKLEMNDRSVVSQKVLRK